MSAVVVAAPAAPAAVVVSERAAVRGLEAMLACVGIAPSCLASLDAFDGVSCAAAPVIAIAHNASIDVVVGLLRRGVAPHRIIVVAPELTRVSFAALVGDLGVDHVIGRPCERAGDVLASTLRRMTAPHSFGLDAVLAPITSRVRIDVRESDQVRPVRAAAGEFCAALDVASRLGEQFCLAVDELVTNALYNAPVDADGHARHAHRSRKEGVSLAAHEACSVEFATDGSTLGVAVRDPFGSLASSTLRANLARCARGGARQVDDKEGGAGLGLFYVYESLSHVVVNVAPAQCTEVLGLLDARGSVREFLRHGHALDLNVDDVASRARQTRMDA